jgi:sensor histidine kinase regulating citrate/malate metabolism
MFLREESSNLDLSTKLQRFELESHFYKEVDAIHNEIRLWKHEYNNNLIVLHKFIEHGENAEALKYIDSINHKARQNIEILQTGNLVLDAVVSSKLWLARSQGIDISVHAMYPENSNIEDNDLCAIAGNLLDNAIEACMRMSDESKNKFITFSLLTKGKNMIITISNSYDGDIKTEGGRFITGKDKRFHGIGIKYVTSIIEKYRGNVQMEYADGIFETNVLIPIVFVREEK